MFNPGQKVTVIGKFQVINVGPEYIEMDAFEKGTVENWENYEKNGFKEVTADGAVKDFDGFQVGDFFALDGVYTVIRSNEIFTKIDCAGKMLSIPNHKIVEVD